jgi:hypothetical protein
MPIDEKGLNLMADIVEANVRGLAHTTDSLIAYEKSRVLELARTIVQLDMILEEATVIDRKTERRLQMIMPQIDNAHRIMEREGELG